MPADDPLKGFLLSVRPGAPRPVRAWPDPVIVDRRQVCFHGYLAEPEALRRRLALPNDATNAAIAAASWRRWTGEVAEHVIGEFAAAVVDGPVVNVLGDRMGLRPVYLRTGADSIVVSTDLAALVRETRESTALDEEYLADLLSGEVHRAAHTPYRHVKRLRLGEYATWRPDGLQVFGGWRPREPGHVGELEDHKERLRATVTQVVAGARPRGAVAVQLSGGLDSSTVLATIGRDEPVHAFSFVYPGAPQSDETPWIRAALADNPVPWHPTDATRHRNFAAGPDFDTYLAAPTHACITWDRDAAEAAAVCAAGASALLTGEGGDAVFLGDLLPWYLADLLRTRQFAELFAESQRWADGAQPPRPASFWLRRAAVDGWRRWRRAKTLSLLPPQPISYRAPWLEPDYVKKLNLDCRASLAGPIRAASVHTQGVLDGVVMAAETVRANYVWGPHQVDIRHPLLALPLVDLALATPWQVGVDPRIDRAVQRYAFQGIVAETTLRRRTKIGPAQAQFSALERNSAWLDALLINPEIVKRGYANAQIWAKSVGQATVGVAASTGHFKNAILVEIWLRQLGRIGPPRMLTGSPHGSA
jgi:asparagine synthase (glutamine-hydrolysing)